MSGLNKKLNGSLDEQPRPGLHPRKLLGSVMILAQYLKPARRLPSPGFLFYLYLFYLVFLVYPITALFQTQPQVLTLLITGGSLSLFILTYLVIITRVTLNRSDYFPSPLASWTALIILSVLATLLSLVFGSNWLGLFIYVGVAAGFTLRTGFAIGLVSFMAGLMTSLGMLTGDDFRNVAQLTLLELAVGLGMVGLARLLATNRELLAARAELAELAIDEERSRFARDLHDLLGHSLSVIALKSELAERLLPSFPQQAAREIADVRTVVQDALQEVRQAVTGYRQPALAIELRKAQEMLRSAGIAYSCEGSVGELSPAVESVLAWAVREGVTNVARHSQAGQCSIQIRRTAETVSIEVLDDGCGGTIRTVNDSQTLAILGSGLSGLRERAARHHGQVEAGQLEVGGFRLCVTLRVTNPPENPVDELSGRE